MRTNSTTDINLAAALLTMGVLPLEENHFQKVKSARGETSVFHFQTATSCGKYKTKDLMEWWGDDQFESENPEHPFAYIKVFHRNKNGLLDWVKQAIATIIVEQDGRYIIMSEDYPLEKQMKLISAL